MLITKDFFYKDNCCSSIIQFLLEEDQRKVELVFENNFRNISEKDKRNTKLIIDDTFRNHFFHWFNDNITRFMTYKQAIKYAVYAAELVLPIFENEYPDDKRPRKAIESAKMCIDDPSDENRKTSVISYDESSYPSSFGYISQSAFAFAYDSARLAARASSKSIIDNNNDISYNSCCFLAAASARNAIRTVHKFKCDIYQKKINFKIIQYGLELLEEKE